MKCDVTRCVMCEYLDKEQSYKNSTKQVLLVNSTVLCNAVKNLLDKFLVITSFRGASHIDFVHEKRHMDVRGWGGGGTCDVSR